MWHVSSRSSVATLRTAIHLLLTYLLTYLHSIPTLGSRAPPSSIDGRPCENPKRGADFTASARQVLSRLVTPVVQRVRVCCEVFDHNGDGFISKLELHRTMNELGVPLTREDLDAMMDATAAAS